MKKTGYFKHYWNTITHKFWVAKGLIKFSIILLYRAIIHDYSKFLPTEAKGYSDAIPSKLLVYGSDEYEKELLRLKPTINHHYQNNSHHPEHYVCGINGMSLLDIVEMYYDWKAAIRKNKNGSIESSLHINKTRFAMTDQLCNIFRNSK